MFTIWTDGSCPENPGGPGGWAFVCVHNETVVGEVSGGLGSTTNNVMEMMAVIEAIAFMEREFTFVQEFKVISDSQYVVRGINEYMRNWKARGWHKRGGLKNKELWQTMYKIVNPARMEFEWVKGHVGIKHNERADELAGIATVYAREGTIVL